MGWDAINLHYVRHKDWHGFINTIDDTMGSLQFYGNGGDILRAAYASQGVEAVVYFTVDYQCVDSDSYDNIYRGQFTFYQYKDVQGVNGCHVECSVESGDSIMMLKNRYDQKVNLDSLLTFDQTGAAGSSQIEVLSVTLGTPPDPSMVNINPGDTYLIPSSGGSWTPGVRNQIAVWSDSGWTYSTPADGQVVIDSSTGNVYIYSETTLAWSVISSFSLSSYPYLGSQIMLPSYTVNMLDAGEIINVTPNMVASGISVIDTTGTVGDPLADPSNINNIFLIDGSDKRFAITPYTSISSDDFPDFPGGVGDQQAGYIDPSGGSGYSFPDISEIFHSNPANIYSSNLVDVDININGFFCKKNKAGPRIIAGFNNDSTLGAIDDDPISAQLYAMVGVGSDLENAWNNRLNSNFTVFDYGSFRFSDGVKKFNFNFHQQVSINPNDKLYLVFFMHINHMYGGSNWYADWTGDCYLGFYSDSIAVNFNSDTPPLIVNVSTDPGYNPKSYIKLSFDTVYAPTPAKMYMVNETFSRIAECVTDGGLKVYSDYFGRTDASPYTSSQDGSGSLECITSGLLIRGQTMASGSHPPITVSMKDMFDAMDAIHQIGMGLENDPHRSGTSPDGNPYQLLRIEPVKYFYSLSHIFPQPLENVDEVTIENSADRVYATFHGGYSKWEGEKAQGLNEFLTRREYRTQHSTATASLDKSCKFIASGYAIETTRRQMGQNTQDWRFDNDTFVICLDRSPGSTPPFAVEQSCILSPTNIPYSDTVYNYRISPIRNAMRWLGTIFQSYASYVAGKLFYTKGAGNVVATGQYDPASDAHTVVLENKPLIENRDIDYGVFASPTDYYPLYSNQTVKFTYPLSYLDWLTITTDPYGLIDYTVNGGATQSGWIEELKYSPFEGTAEFTLKKKI